MAYVGGKRVEAGDRTRSRDHSVQEFAPSAAWTEDSDYHFLLVDLPDFKKEEVKLQVDRSGQITVKGERLVKNNKYIYFDKTFKAPKNSDIDRITGKFDGEILYVTLPKKAQVEKKEEPQSGDQINKDESIAKDHDSEETKEPSIDDHKRTMERNDQEQTEEKKKKKKGSCVDSFRKDDVEKWEGKCSILERATKILWTNKEILIAAAVALSLGMLMSRKFESVHYD